MESKQEHGSYTGIYIAVIIAVTSHMGATIWWASRINTTMGFLRDDFLEMRKDTKALDAKFAAIGMRIDDLKEKIALISMKK